MALCGSNVVEGMRANGAANIKSIFKPAKCERSIYYILNIALYHFWYLPICPDRATSRVGSMQGISRKMLPELKTRPEKKL